MDRFPDNFNEELFGDLAREKHGAWSQAQKTLQDHTRKQIHNNIVSQFKAGHCQIVFEFPDELQCDLRLEILKELFERFPSKQFWYWCVIHYADVEEYRKVNPENPHISWKYRIDL